MNWHKGNTHYILAKNLYIFFPFPDTLGELGFKSDGLIKLVEEISRQQFSGGIMGITGSV